jgi:hypothetical protein
MTKQPEALKLADYLTDRNRLDLTCDEAAAELRRLHELNLELLAALNVAALAIYQYRTLGAPHAYWDDVEYQAAKAIAKAEGEQK